MAFNKFCTSVFCLLLLKAATFLNAQTKPAEPAPARTALDHLPILFETNVGQADPSFRYIARHGALGVAAGSNGVTFSMPGTGAKRAFLSMRFPGRRRKPQVVAEDGEKGKVNYLVGSDRSKWRRQIPTFRKIRYQSLYRGVDLVFYGNGENLEHDFVLAPGSDPGQIVLQMDGAKGVFVDRSGDLVVRGPSSDLHFKKPVAYQPTAEGNRVVDASYRIHGSRVKFSVATYNPRLPLVIDPVLTYSTWIAGTNQDYSAGMTVDSAGNVYVTGSTSSNNFPRKGGFACSTCAYNPDIFVTKLDPTGANLVYSTVVGGSGTDQSMGIGIDGQGNAIVGGLTGSSDFPLKNSYTTFQGFTTTYGFVLSLSQDGSQLNYSSLLGQIGFSSTYPAVPLVVAADQAGSAYFSGQTYDPAFPITAGTIGSTVVPYPFSNLFLTQLDPAGNLTYSTVIPGTLPYSNYEFDKNDFPPDAIAVDGAGNTYIGGLAGPGLPTTAGTISPTFPGDQNNPSSYVGFVLKVNATASAVSYGTYLPYTAFVRTIAPLASGETYVAGIEASTSFPVTPGAFQTVIPPGPNCTCGASYIAKMDAAATTYEYATFLTGTPAFSNFGTNVMSLSLDATGNVWAAGITGSSDFPLKNPVVTTFPSNQGAGFITELKPDLSNDLFSTFLTGTTGLYHTTALYAAAGGNGIVFAAGTDDDTDFPTTPGSFEPSLPAGVQLYSPHTMVAKIDTTVSGATASFSALSLNFGIWLLGTPSPAQTITVTNSGNGNLQIQSIAITGTDFSQTNTCSGAVAPGATCQISVIFTPSNLTPQTQTMTVTSNSAVSSQLLSLYGQGGQPQFTFGIPQANFGDQLVGTSGAPVPITLVNVGNANLIVSNATVSGDYSVVNNCTAEVAPHSFCTVNVTFSPKAAGTRVGALVVSDNAPGSPQILQLSGNGITTYPLPAITTVQAGAINSNGATLKITGTSFFPASTVQWNGNSRPSIYLDEGDIWATLSAADVSTIGEASVTVSNPTPGGGISSAAIATVYLQIMQSTGDTVYEPKSGLVYATVPANAASNADSVIAITPSTGVIANAIATGNNPHRIAISGDGSLLYVGLDQTGQVAQYALPAGTLLGMVQLPVDSFFGPKVAQDIKVLPGAPHSYVVSLAYTQTSPASAGIMVYDDQTPRANVIGDWSSSGVQGNSLLFLSSAATLYDSDMDDSDYSFYRLNIDATGISLKDSTQGLGGTALSTDGTLIYEDGGRIVDPTSLAVVNTFTPPGGSYLNAMFPSSGDSHLYSLETSYPYELLLSSADLSSLNLLGTIHFPGQQYPQSMLRWGSQGLAIRIGWIAHQQQNPSPYDALFFVKSSLVTAQPDFELSASQSGGLSQTVKAGQTASYDLTLQSTRSFSGTVALTCSGAPQYATCTVSPSSTALAADGSDTFMVSISTSQTQSAGIHFSARPLFAAFGVLSAFFLAPLSWKRKSKQSGVLAGGMRMFAILMMAISVGTMLGCGSGGSTTSTTVNTVAPGTYTLQLNATSGNIIHTVGLTLVVQ